MTRPDIQSLLSTAQQQLSAISDSALLDAEVLLCHCLGKPRTHLRAWPEKQPETEQIDAFFQALQLRLTGVPVAYITGKREFWSRDFTVSPDVLIPRPDTELLVELCLNLSPAHQTGHIIDLGTGSGIIAITLATELPHCSITATDISSDALSIARKNAEFYRLNNITFLESNWFEQVTTGNFNLVISNPPYIAADDPHLQQGDVRHEPHSALIAPDHGLADIKQLASQARHHLCKHGHLLIEHGYNQQAQVQAIFRHYNYQDICTYNDLGNNPRVTIGRWTQS
jgi:release factor glutamine methyltransferase